MIFKFSSDKLSILSNNQLEQINACKMMKIFDYHFSFPFTCILIQVCLCPYADFKDAQRQLKSYTHTHTHPHWHATVSSLFSWTKASQIYINLHHNTPFQRKCPRSCARISHRFRSIRKTTFT